ncbi:GNAT family N-acetyltransferase [Paenibacillus sp. NPDC058071]|uniref:GNAT family N-acetyltransferase n=1 Tax=Paenibacillus sp. NPDC058071 TaxID=3346326 RepID=UPI0036D850BE
MKLNIYNDCIDRDWERVAYLMRYFDLSDAPANTHQQAFENSYVVTFVYDDQTLIGFGRAISDGVSQAAIYNIAVDPNYHSQGIGKRIVQNLLSFVKHCNVVLYTHPDTIDFYKRLGFRRMKTGMAIYVHEEKVEQMGFIE